MTRQKKTLQRDISIVKQMQDDALQIAQNHVTEFCRAIEDGACTCSEILPNIFAGSIEELANRLVESEAADELCDWLSQVYEHLLLYTVKNEGGACCKITLIAKSKKRLGNFYTPKDLAKFTVEKALHELVYERAGNLKSAEQILALKIVDPSMGSGIFLRVALEYLSERLMESRSGASDLMSCRKDVLRHCIYGVDVDEGAVLVARLLLSIQCHERRDFNGQLEKKLKRGNSLIGVTANLQGSSTTQADTFCNNFFRRDIDAPNRFNYFHWTLQFPEVFSTHNPGFDAVLGNPPWEIMKANSREFFQQKHEQYWSLGKQEALLKQDELRSTAQIDDEWNQYQDDYKLLSHWISKSGAYEFQGSSDINAYKLFLELSLKIAKINGVVSLIVPSSIYSDKGSVELRSALLNLNNWKFLRSFHNAEGLFDIHRSFKFCVVSFSKGGITEDLQASFDSRNLTEANLVAPLSLAVNKLKNFSPKWLSVPEVESVKDLELVEKIGINSIRFEDFVEEFDLKFKREFDMTNDSHKFILRDDAEQNGYRPDAHGRWVHGESEDVALPLYEGRMIGQFDVAQKGWVRGKGRQALWLPVPYGRIMPQYLLAARDYHAEHGALKVGFLGVGSATNMRSMIAACMGRYPCGNSVPTFHCADPRIALVLAACLNSFVFDYVLRMRLVGNNLNYFILQEGYLPRPDLLLSESAVVEIAARLSANQKHFAPEIGKFLPAETCCHEIDDVERLRLRCILDALIAELYGLESDDLKHILRDCDAVEPGAKAQKEQGLRLSPRGFWRVDKNKPAQERQTVLTLTAFESLRRLGRPDFLSQNLQNALGSQV